MVKCDIILFTIVHFGLLDGVSFNEDDHGCEKFPARFKKTV